MERAPMKSPEPSWPDWATWKVPALTLKAPVWVWTPVAMRVSPEILVKVPAPAITPVKVFVLAVEPFHW